MVLGYVRATLETTIATSAIGNAKHTPSLGFWYFGPEMETSACPRTVLYQYLKNQCQESWIFESCYSEVNVLSTLL